QLPSLASIHIHLSLFTLTTPFSPPSIRSDITRQNSLFFTDRPDNCRTCTIAEKNASISVGPINNLRKFVSSDNKHMLIYPGFNKLFRCNKPVNKTRTSSPKIHSSRDRKSTRLNSSHVSISYAVFCLKKK